MINLFIALGAQMLIHGPNCYNSALVSTGVMEHFRFVSHEEMMTIMKSSSCEAVPSTQLKAGDIQVYFQGDTLVHANVYLNETESLNKRDLYVTTRTEKTLETNVREQFKPTSIEAYRCTKRALEITESQALKQIENQIHLMSVQTEVPKEFKTQIMNKVNEIESQIQNPSALMSAALDSIKRQLKMRQPNRQWLIENGYLFPSSDTVELDLNITKGLYGGFRINLPCSFAGVKKSCKLDTGALFSRIDGIEASENAEILSEFELSSAIGNAQVCNWIRVKNSTFGTSEKLFHIGRLSVFSCPESPKSVALAGLETMWKKTFSLDIKNKKLQITRRQLEESKSTSFIKDSKTKHIVLDFEMLPSKVKAKGIFDTGAVMTIVSQQFVKAHPENFVLIESYQSGKDTFGNPISSELMVMKRAEIQGQQIVAEYVKAIDFTPIYEQSGEKFDFIIGANFMKNFTWTFDLLNDRYTVSKAQKAVTKD